MKNYSKKSLVIKLVLLLALVALNVIILCNPLSYINYDVNLCMSVESSEKDTYQVFYSNDLNFYEENSVRQDYTELGQQQQLQFPLDKQATYLRIDVGSLKETVQLSSVYFECDGNIIEVELSDFAKAEISYDLDEVNLENGLIIIQPSGNDPYVILNIEKYKITSLVDQAIRKQTVIQKTVYILLVDLMACLLVLFYRRKVQSMSEMKKTQVLVLNLAKSDFKTKFAGSYLGVIWAFVQPMVTVGVYWFVFQVGFRSQPVEDFPFALWLMCGLVPWFFFSETMMTGTNSLIEYSYLVKKVVFKIEILPIVKTTSSLFVHIFFAAFLILVFWVSGYTPDIYYLQIIYYSYAMVLFVLGFSYITSSIVLFIKDLGQLINISLQVLMWMTPIVWDYTIMPENLRWLLKLNPMYYIVEGYRDALINKVWFWEHFGTTVYFWIITAVVIWLGMRIFKRLRTHFADVL